MLQRVPHLNTVQRDQLSKQLRNGFLIWHKNEKRYEKWSKDNRNWTPLGGNATSNTSAGGVNAGDPNAISVDQDDYDFFLFNSLPQTVTMQEAHDDWNNI